MFALLKPLAGDRLKCVVAFKASQPFGLFFCFAGVVSGSEHFTCLRPPLAGIGQADFGIDAQRQQFFLAAKKYLSRQYLLPDGVTSKNMPSPSVIL